jgi:hypothetical protein
MFQAASHVDDERAAGSKSAVTVSSQPDMGTRHGLCPDPENKWFPVRPPYPAVEHFSRLPSASHKGTGAHLSADMRTEKPRNHYDFWASPI